MDMIDIFIGSPDYSKYGELGSFRQEIRNLVLLAWQRLLPKSTIHTAICSLPERWKLADNLCTSSIYIIADDDCFPPYNLDLGYVFSLFEANVDFGILAVGNAPCGVNMYIDEDITEVNSAGGIRFMRKGMVEHWPERFNGDDNQHSALISFRSAYFNNYSLLHLGAGCSIWQVIREEVNA